MTEFVFKYWIDFIMGIIATYCVKKVNKFKIENDSSRTGMRALLRNSITKECIDYIERGYCPLAARDNIQNMYESYHLLGGNGVVTEMVNEVKKLPFKKIKQD